MAETRLNGVIRALESGKPAFATFSPATPDAAIALHGTKYDGVVFETEHNVWDGTNVRHGLQYLLNRGEVAKSGSLAPKITPIVRIPPNGAEMNQHFAKQALDMGAYGIVWPHVGTVEQAYNAVSSCRYPTMKEKSAARAVRPARRRPAYGGALLGPEPAGILRSRRRLAAQSERRDIRHSHDRGSRGPAESRRDAEEGERHRRHPHRRGRSFPGAGFRAPV